MRVSYWCMIILLFFSFACDLLIFCSHLLFFSIESLVTYEIALQHESEVQQKNIPSRANTRSVYIKAAVS